MYPVHFHVSCTTCLLRDTHSRPHRAQQTCPPPADPPMIKELARTVSHLVLHKHNPHCPSPHVNRQPPPSRKALVAEPQTPIHLPSPLCKLVTLPPAAGGCPTPCSATSSRSSSIFNEQAGWLCTAVHQRGGESDDVARSYQQFVFA